MKVKREENHPHANGKIKVMEAIISFLQEGRTLDLLQTFLLQKGTFEHDSSIQWDLKKYSSNKEVLDFKINVNKLMDEPAFWPKNTKNRSFLNLDEQNKIIVVERSDENEKFVIVINISSFELFNYKIPVRSKNNFELVLDSQKEFNIKKIYENNESNNFELIDREIEIFKIPAYGVYVFKELI